MIHHIDYIHEDREGNEITYDVEYTRKKDAHGMLFEVEILSVKINGSPISVDDKTQEKIFEQIEEADIDDDYTHDFSNDDGQ